MTLVLADTSAVALRREAERPDGLRRIEVTAGTANRAREVQEIPSRRGYHRGPSPVDLLAAAAAEIEGAGLWHCDRHFELIAETTGRHVRRVGR